MHWNEITWRCFMGAVLDPFILLAQRYDKKKWIFFRLCFLSEKLSRHVATKRVKPCSGFPGGRVVRPCRVAWAWVRCSIRTHLIADAFAGSGCWPAAAGAGQCGVQPREPPELAEVTLRLGAVTAAGLQPPSRFAPPVWPQSFGTCIWIFSETVEWGGQAFLIFFFLMNRTF